MAKSIGGDFRKLWAAQAVSEVGSRITREGIPLTAVMVLHAGPSTMGLLSGLGAAAVLAFGLMAGVWVDRWPRRPILIAADLGRAVLLGSIPVAAWRGWLGLQQLYVVMGLTGILTVLFDVAYQSYLPSIVEPDGIVEGNTKLMLSATTAEVVGPGMTGLLVQTMTAPVAILFDALSFLFSAAMVGMIRRGPEAREGAIRKNELPFAFSWRESLAGFRFVSENRVLRILAIRSVTTYFFYGFPASLYILYLVRDLHLAPGQMGVVIASGGLGGVAGSLVSARIVERLGLGWTLLGSAAVQCAAFALIPLADGPPLVTMAYLFGQQVFGDAAFAIWSIHEVSLRQALAPAEVLGRVNAAMQLATRGVLPIGAVAGGFLADAIGIRAVLAMAAVGLFASIGWLWPLRCYNRSEPFI